MVFGNGRTHTGEVDGSGGSRLANYCLRAPASQNSTQDEPAEQSKEIQWTCWSVSEWLMVVKGGV